MKLFTFWIGPLSYIERLCLTSMLANGHNVDFYTYDSNPDVPSGVTVRDASEVLPRERMFLHAKRGTPAVFSDVFRYKALQRNLGVWVDCDVFLLRRLDTKRPYIFGLEDPHHINCAVLYLPPDSSFLRELNAFVDARVVVPFDWPPTRRLKQYAASLFGLHKTLAELPLGTTGPRALTALARKHHLSPSAVEVFYPVPWHEAATLFEPSTRVDDAITPATQCVHLWRSKIAPFLANPPPPGSFIARMCERYAKSPNPDTCHDAGSFRPRLSADVPI